MLSSIDCLLHKLTLDTTGSLQGGAERIARDMNRHSAVVLQGPGMLQSQQANGGSSATAVDAYQEQSGWRGKGHSGLEDLRQTPATEVEGLHIQDPRRYFERSSAVSHNLTITILSDGYAAILQ